MKEILCFCFNLLLVVSLVTDVFLLFIRYTGPGLAECCDNGTIYVYKTVIKSVILYFH